MTWTWRVNCAMLGYMWSVEVESVQDVLGNHGSCWIKLQLWGPPGSWCAIAHACMFVDGGTWKRHLHSSTFNMFAWPDMTGFPYSIVLGNFQIHQFATEQVWTIGRGLLASVAKVVKGGEVALSSHFHCPSLSFSALEARNPFAHGEMSHESNMSLNPW